MRIVKRRLRLYVSKTKYIKLDNFLVIVFVCIASTLLVQNQIRGKEIMEAFSEETQESQKLANNSETSEEVQEEEETETVRQESVKTTKYRMTYYYTGDGTGSGSVTASGKSTTSFQTNEHGWYTYEGKLVVATASKSLKSWASYKGSVQKTYNLYDELSITINGMVYDAIVLDVCGACMRSAKIDLFVKDKKSGLDTTVYVNQK